VPGRVQHADRRAVAEGQRLVVAHEHRFACERSDRVHVELVHHDLRVGIGARNVGRRVAVILVFVSDEDILKMVVALA
jgi:hypothetical protein